MLHKFNDSPYSPDRYGKFEVWVVTERKKIHNLVGNYTDWLEVGKAIRRCSRQWRRIRYFKIRNHDTNLQRTVYPFQPDRDILVVGFAGTLTIGATICLPPNPVTLGYQNQAQIRVCFSKGRGRDYASGPKTSADVKNIMYTGTIPDPELYVTEAK